VAFVKGAEEIPFAQVARAIDVMRGAGIDHVGLITPGAMPKEYQTDLSGLGPVAIAGDNPCSQQLTRKFCH